MPHSYMIWKAINKSGLSYIGVQTQKNLYVSIGFPHIGAFSLLFIMHSKLTEQID